MKKTHSLLALAAVLALSLTGCGRAPDSAEGDQGPKSDAGTLEVFVVALPEGKAVECVGSKYTGSASTPDCDWANVQNAASGALSEDESGTFRSYVVTLQDGREVLCVASKYEGSALSSDCNFSGAARPKR